MKKVGNPNSISRVLLFSLAFMLTFSIQIFAQEAAATAGDPAATAAAPVAAAASGDAAAGKALFNAQCAACHKLDAKMTGPALRGVGDKYEKEWLYKWIRNSAELIKSGDERANKIFNEYNQSPMTAFPQLSDADIDNIIAYTMEPVAAAPTIADVATVPGGKVEGGGISNEVILGALALVLAMLVVMLFLVNNVLSKIAKVKKTGKQETIKTWSRASVILPSMIGTTVAVYNGKQHIPVFISDQYVGHKLGEFVSTRNFKTHIKADRKGKR